MGWFRVVEGRLGRCVVGCDGLWLIGIVEGSLGRFVFGLDGLGGLRVGREILWLVGMV